MIGTFLTKSGGSTASVPSKGISVAEFWLREQEKENWIARERALDHRKEALADRCGEFGITYETLGSGLNTVPQPNQINPKWKGTAAGFFAADRGRQDWRSRELADQERRLATLIKRKGSSHHS